MKKRLLLFFVIFIVVVSMVQMVFFDAALSFGRISAIAVSGVISTLLFWLIAFRLIKR